MPGTSLPSSTATFGKNTLNFMSHCNWSDVCWYLIRYPPKVLLREISVNAMVVVFVKGKRDALYLSSSTLGSNFLHSYIMTHLPCNPQVDIVHRTNHYLSSIINNCTVITCIVGLKKQFKALPTKSCSLDKATTRLSAK